MYGKRFTPDGFGIKEWVDKETYDFLGEEAWKLFDIRILLTMDTLKKLTGWTIIANTWGFRSGKFGRWSQRGYRLSTSTTGAKQGAHYKGMALDFDCYKDGKMIPAAEVRQFIIDNINKFEHIKCLEIDINWVHLDVMDDIDNPTKRGAVTSGKILLYSPKTGVKVVDINELQDSYNER